MGKGHKIIFAYVACVILILAIWLVFRDGTRAYTSKLVSTDREQILQEVPFLEITEEEWAAGEILKEAPEIQDILEAKKQEGASQENLVLPMDSRLSSDVTEKLVGHLIPEDAEYMYVEIFADIVYLRYSVLNVDTNIYYPMEDSQEPYKGVSVFNADRDAGSNVYYMNYGNDTYEKYKRVRIWFPWLQGY